MKPQEHKHTEPKKNVWKTSLTFWAKWGPNDKQNFCVTKQPLLRLTKSSISCSHPTGGYSSTVSLRSVECPIIAGPSAAESLSLYV